MSKQTVAKAKLERIMDELNSGKLLLTCGKHGYVAYRKGESIAVIPPKPTGCPDCWKAYYFTVHSLVAPHMRQEHLDELESVIMHVKESVEKGKFDFIPEVNPTVSYQKDGFDEVLGDYKPDIKLTDLEAN